ncbi:MAG: T9SS type A sorting domain-containing protein, partial [candidate division KSB1 bacterium]|nr:T9SS type A sorting domain-containing protein [candidate division KSB1 bacterium]
GTFGGGVFKSANGGANWSAANAGLTELHVYALEVDPQTPTTLYAGTGGGLFKSVNAGSSWSAINTGLGDLNVRCLAIDPQDPNTLYVGTYGGGVFKSTNGGSSWHAVNNGLTYPWVGALAIHPETTTIVYAGTYGPGVFQSTDGGMSWSAVNTGLLAGRVYALAMEPQDPSTLYAATNAGVWKRPLSEMGTSVEEVAGRGLQEYDLAQNYPNPFNSQTVIRYQVPSASCVRLTLRDALGREVRVLAEGWVGAGVHEARLEASQLPSGVYLYCLEAGQFKAERKLLLVK